MKKIALGVVSLSLVSSMAFAGSFYGGGDLGFLQGSEEWDGNGNSNSYDFSNLDYGAHIGYMLNYNSQLELSFKMLTFNFKDNDFVDEKGTQFGLDYIHSFNLSSMKIKPYLGIGLTFNNKEINIQGLDEDNFSGTGLKFRAGSYYSLTPKLEIGAELHYDLVSWQEVEFQGTGETLSISSNYYGIGTNINYKF